MGFFDFLKGKGPGKAAKPRPRVGLGVALPRGMEVKPDAKLGSRKTGLALFLAEGPSHCLTAVKTADQQPEPEEDPFAGGQQAGDEAAPPSQELEQEPEPEPRGRQTASLPAGLDVLPDPAALSEQLQTRKTGLAVLLTAAPRWAAPDGQGPGDQDLPPSQPDPSPQEPPQKKKKKHPQALLAPSSEVKIPPFHEWQPQPPTLPDDIVVSADEATVKAQLQAHKSNLGALLRESAMWVVHEQTAGDQDLPPGPEDAAPTRKAQKKTKKTKKKMKKKQQQPKPVQRDLAPPPYAPAPSPPKPQGAPSQEPPAPSPPKPQGAPSQQPPKREEKDAPAPSPPKPQGAPSQEPPKREEEKDAPAPSPPKPQGAPSQQPPKREEEKDAGNSVRRLSQMLRAQRPSAPMQDMINPGLLQALQRAPPRSAEARRASEAVAMHMLAEAPVSPEARQRRRESAPTIVGLTRASIQGHLDQAPTLDVPEGWTLPSYSPTSSSVTSSPPSSPSPSPSPSPPRREEPETARPKPEPKPKPKTPEPTRPKLVREKREKKEKKLEKRERAERERRERRDRMERWEPKERAWDEGEGEGGGAWERRETAQESDMLASTAMGHSRLLCCAPDGDHVLLACGAAVVAWDTRLDDRAVLGGGQGHPSPVLSGAYLGGGGDIVTVSGGIAPTLCVWDAVTGRLLRRAVSRRAEQQLTVVACGEEGHFAVVEPDAVSLWTAKGVHEVTSRPVREAARHLHALWVPGTERLALVGTRTVQLLQVTARHKLVPVRWLALEHDVVAATALDSRLALAQVTGALLQLHDREPHAMFETLDTLPWAPTCMCGDQAGGLRLGTAQGEVHGWTGGRAGARLYMPFPASLRSRVTVPRCETAHASRRPAAVTALAVASRDTQVVGFSDSTLAVCVDGVPHSWRFSHLRSRISSIGWTDSVFATGSEDQSVCLYSSMSTGLRHPRMMRAQAAWADAPSGVLDVPRSVSDSLSYLSGSKPQLPISAIALHPNGRRVAVGTADGGIRLIDPATGAVEAQVRMPGRAAVTGLAFSQPEGAVLVCASAKGQVSVLRASRSFGELQQVQGEVGLTRQVVVAASDDVVISAQTPRLLQSHTFNATSGAWELSREFPLDAVLVDAVRHPSGELLVALTESGCVLVYAVASGELRKVIPTCDRSWRASMACVDPAGIYVAVALRRRAPGGLQRVVVYAVGTGDFAAGTPEGEDAITAVTWGPGGERIAVAGESGAVVLWRLPEPHLRNIKEVQRRTRVEGEGRVWRKLHL